MSRHYKISMDAFVALSIYFAIGFSLLLNFAISTFSASERLLFVTLIVAYFVVVGLVVLAIVRHHLYFFEPFSFISFWYIGIFIYRPLQDLFSDSVSYAGINLVESGPKATMLFTLGFVAFYCGYYSKKKRKHYSRRALENDNSGSMWWLMLSWIVFYSFCIISQLSKGFSLAYLFSLGQQGERAINENNTVLLFLSNFAVTLLVVWLMIIVRTKKTGLKIIITLLTIIYLIMRNGRWLILIMGMSPFVYYYTKKRKTPRLSLTIVLCFLALVLFAWMQMNRYNISTGREMQWFSDRGGLTLGLLLSPFDSDLTTYTTFYGMVQNYPNTFPYMYGRTFLYVFILFVPRVLWSGKPDNPVRDMTEHSLGLLARANGRAVANIGEFYANFGIIGIIVLMFVFGYICSKLKNMYENPSENKLIMYSILYPLLFQWVARGNFSGNFYYTLFAFLPLLIKRIIENISRRRL